MSDTTTTATIILFVPRGRRPRVGISIRCDFLAEDRIGQMTYPANSDEAARAGEDAS